MHSFKNNRDALLLKASSDTCGAGAEGVLLLERASQMLSHTSIAMVDSSTVAEMGAATMQVQNPMGVSRVLNHLCVCVHRNSILTLEALNF